MSQRVQQALDGELSVDDLSPPECNELQVYRAAIGAAVGPVHHLASIDVSPEVRERVAPHPLWRAVTNFLNGLWAPKTLVLRPVVGLAVALALSATLWLSASDRQAAAAPGRVVVQFRLGAPEAREVALVGDFNGWKPTHQLHQVADGVWVVDVALEPGVYNYVFMVDGTTLRLDPLAPHVTDGFGGSSSRLSVLAEARS